MGSKAYNRSKRGLDIILGVALLVLCAPLIVGCALALAVVLRASPLFVQERVGLHGRPFRIWKLRTLPPTTPAYADKYSLVDVRIPRVAAAVRRLKIDELPQLVQVISGRMSLVGPRPEMRFLDSHFEPAFAAVRRTVRPGCTGLWQVSSSCDQLIHEAPQYDLAYLERRSFAFDAWIVARTVRMLVTGQTVRLADLPDSPALRPQRQLALLPDPAAELARRTAAHGGLDLLLSTGD